MTKLALRFELEPGTDPDAAAHAIRRRLASLDAVEAVDARPDNARITGLEIAGAIAVAVQVIHGTRQLVAELRSFINDLKAIRGEIAGLKTITLDAMPEPIAIEQVTDELAKLAHESHSSPAMRKEPG